MRRKVKNVIFYKRILVVSGKNGTAKVNPFNDSQDHAGEPFYIHGKFFKVSSENRITFGKKYMEEHGLLRGDGKRAFVLETGTKWLSSSEYPAAKRKKYKDTRVSRYDTYFVRGGNILTVEDFDYSGRTGDLIDPVRSQKLKMENTADYYGDKE